MLNFSNAHFFCDQIETFSSLFSHVTLFNSTQLLQNFDKHNSFIPQIEFVPIILDLFSQRKQQFIFKLRMLTTNVLFKPWNQFICSSISTNNFDDKRQFGHCFCSDCDLKLNSNLHLHVSSLLQIF